MLEDELLDYQKRVETIKGEVTFLEDAYYSGNSIRGAYHFGELIQDLCVILSMMRKNLEEKIEEVRYRNTQ